MGDNQQVPTSLDDEIPPALPAPELPAALDAAPVPPALDAAPVRLALPAAPAGAAVERPVDALGAASVTLARQAAIDIAGAGQVGDHVTVHAEGDRVATHQFACLSRGYRGWRWAVTVSRVPRARTATVSEVVLLPGPDSVLAPSWLPWADRIAPGDLGSADQLPYRGDDPLLEPGYTATGEEDSDRLAIWELGLGRVRVLSPEGRAEVAHRWYSSDRGPTSDEAVHAAAACSSCGYFLPLAGGMRQVFGVCANEWSPSDARVVSVDHGCGAHSETDVERAAPETLPPPILDETGYEAVVVAPRQTEGEGSEAPVEATEVLAEAEVPAEAPVLAEAEVPAEAEVLAEAPVVQPEPAADAEPRAEAAVAADQG